jgi:hypothetical protein
MRGNGAKRRGRVTEDHTLAGAYALNALDDLERAAFDRHLRVCASCALEVLELQETAALLSADTAVAPPPGLRDGVLTAVSRTPQERAGGLARSAAVPLALWRRSTAVAVAASILAVGGVAAVWSVSQDRVRQAQATAAAAAAERTRVADVLAAPDARLRTEDVTGGGRVAVLVAPSRDAAVAVLTGLADPGPGRTYQLWLIRGGAAESVGVLDAGQLGTTKLLERVGNADTFGISREPLPRGSRQPTADQVVGLLPLR